MPETLAPGSGALKDKGGPGAAAAGMSQNETVRAVKARDQVLLPAQKSRQHEHSPWRQCGRDLRCQEGEGPRENVGEDQIVRRVLGKFRIDETVGRNRADERTDV